MPKNFFITGICFLFPFFLMAQDRNSSFHFLNLPFSSHAASLGGENISIIENDLAMAIQNPALLSCVADNTLALNYMHYMEGVNAAGAAFAKVAGQRATWAAAVQYADYGKMPETDETNTSYGTFTAKDISLSGIYTYDLSDKWSGGVRTNLIYSHYDTYTAFAVGVDLGLNYYDAFTGFSFSVLARNLGGQLKAFEERRERLPADLQMGFSKRMAHAPFRLSVTLHGLNRWGDGDMATAKFGRKLLNHVVLGLDFLPTKNLYASVGYNFLRASEMEINGSSRWAGFTAGAGIQVKRIRIGAGYAKYHPSASSLIFDLGYTL